MKIEFKKRLPITIAIIVTSILTFIFSMFALQSIHNENNLWLRILTQGGLCLTMLLSGVNCFVYLKQRVLGVFMWLVSAFLLFVIVDTIIKSVGI